jgi:hypothetical protein
MLIQNLLPDFLRQNIYDDLNSTFFPWYWQETANYKDKKNEDLFQFTHTMYVNNEKNSDKLDLILPIIWFFQKETNIKIKSIFRVKANLTTRYNMSEKDVYDSIHIDHESDNYLSLIYYVNDSDGNTIIYNENKDEITPKANNLYYFKSNTKHSALYPKENKKRIVINFILEIEQN